MKEKSKIIYIQGSNSFGGLERITMNYEKAFSKYNPLVLPLKYTKSGLEYKNTLILDRKNKISFLFKFIGFVRKSKDAVFHLQLGGTHVLFLTYLSGARKIIYHFHGMRSKKNLVEKIIWKFFDSRIKKIANSNFTKNEVIRKYNIYKNFYIIPNLIDTDKFIYKERNDINNNNKFIITYAGRLVKGKNLQLLPLIAKLSKTVDQNIEYRIVGDGPEKKDLQNKINEFDLKDCMKILPFTEEIDKVYTESNLFILLSEFESFGNVVVEAIFAGVPVLCNRIPSLLELIHDDIFFIRALDPKLIAEQIRDIKFNYSEILNRLKPIYLNLRGYIDNVKIIKDLERIYLELGIQEN